MKQILVLIFAAALFWGCQQDDGKSGPQMNADAVQLEDNIDSVSYSIGYNMGMALHADSVDVQFDQFVAGYLDGMDGKDPRFTEDEMQQILQNFQSKVELQKRLAEDEDLKKQKEFNEKEGPAYLEKIKKDPKTKKTDFGVYYTIEKEGTGPKPKRDEAVEFHLVGKFIDGTEFENTYKNGQPIKMPVQAFGVEGIIDAVTNTPVGGKYIYTIPSELAYGENGMGPIPPNAIIIFEIEMLDAMSMDGMPPMQMPGQPGQPMPGQPMPQGGGQPMPR